MPSILSNARVNIRRRRVPASFPATPEWYQVESDIPAWFKISERSRTDLAESESSMTEAELRLEVPRSIAEGDLVERIPDTEKRYRVIAVSDILNGHGTKIGHRARMIRDTAVEL